MRGGVWWLVVGQLGFGRQVADLSFVWLSDLHLDVAFKADKDQRNFCRGQDFNASAFLNMWDVYAAGLKPTPAAEEEAPPLIPVEEDPLLQAYYGRYGCDSPASLVWATLRSIKADLQRRPAAFVLVTGDLGAHYWSNDLAGLRFPSLQTASRLIVQALGRPAGQEPALAEASLLSSLDFLRRIDFFEPRDPPGVDSYPQTIACVGNNDLSEDYRPTENSDWNRIHYELWQGVFVPPSQRDNFVRGEYYSVLVEKIPGLKVLCLNTNWFSKQVKLDNEGLPEDPAGQFHWFEEELEVAQLEGQKVIIAGHIPPAQSLFRNAQLGFSVDQQWHAAYLDRFDAIIDGFANVIVGKYFGHLHTDEFRVQRKKTEREDSSRGSEQRYDLILMAPSVSPNHGNNPSWRRMNVRTIRDAAGGRLRAFRPLNYTQRYAPLYGAESPQLTIGSFDASRVLAFDHEYGSDKILRSGSEINAERIYKALRTRLTDTDQHAKRVWNNELIESGIPPVFMMRCVFENWRVPADIKECVNNYVRRTEEKVEEAGHQEGLIVVEM